MNFILIIDEDQKSLSILRELLSGKRYRIIATASPRQGLEFAKAGIPALLIMDMGHNPSETLRLLEDLKLDEITRGISIVVTLRTASKPFIVAARKMGVLDFLLKPFDTKKLEQKLEQILSRSLAAGQKGEYWEQETGALKQVFVGNRLFLFLKSDINELLRSHIEKKTEDYLRRSPESVILDIRAVSSLNEEAMQVFKKMVDFLKNFKVIIVAGKNYGKLLSDGVDQKAMLFLSTEELNNYFVLIEGDVPD